MLLAVYYLLLQKEKMYRFNRFYLMFSILFSYTVPFISIQSENLKPSNRIQTTFETTQQALDITPGQENFNLINWIWIIYGTVTLIFLIRMIKSFIAIKNMKGRRVKYQNQNILITKECTSPFSFWNTIYLGQNYLRDNKIDPRIFLHEKSHLEQKHSVDVIIIEILKAFTWFNPSIFFYQKAIITNHEFLADEAVLKKNFNVKDYQHLILDEIISTKNHNLIHTFNFTNTKKRFIMMNTKKSKLTNLKKVICIPALMITFGLFVQKTYANPIEKMVEETQKRISEPVKNVISESESTLNNTENEFSDHQSETQERLITSRNEDRVVQDTIRPKESENTVNKNKTAQNTINQTDTPLAQNEATSLPQYPGGINEMRDKMLKVFDAAKLDPGKNNEVYKTELSYIIAEDGSITNIKAMGNNEAFNMETIVSFKKANENITWKPAKKDGKPAPYKMRIPLTMSFEN